MASVGYGNALQGQVSRDKPAPNNNGKWVPEDVDKYGFQPLDPPDAGANQDPSELAAATPITTGVS